jgi:hypothetical protein
MYNGAIMKDKAPGLFSPLGMPRELPNISSH